MVLAKRMSQGMELLVVAHGGQAFSDADLGRIAFQVGVEGGAVFSSGAVHPVTQVTGTFGGWSDSTSAWVGALDSKAVEPTAGRPVAALSMVAAQGNGAGGGDFLSRVETGTLGQLTIQRIRHLKRYSPLGY